MPEQRIDLEAAGKLLGLHPNSIRARAKKGKIRNETDNRGKIWVFVDPEKIANDRAEQAATMKPSKPPQEPTIKDTMQALTAVFESQIETLKTENEGLKGTVSDLRSRLDQSEAERRKLTDALLEQSARPAPQEGRRRRFRLLGWLGPRQH